MKLPSFRRLTATTSTVDQIGEELGRLDKIRLDSGAEIERLEGLRPGFLIDTDADQVERCDMQIARCRTAIEQALARTAVLEPEWRAADQAQTEAAALAERASLYDKAVAARTAGRKALREYEATAQKLAGILEQIGEAERAIGRANDNLPDGREPLEQVEPFNGRHSTVRRVPVPLVERWFKDGYSLGASRPPGVTGLEARLVKGAGPDFTEEGEPGTDHVSLLDCVALPKLNPTTGYLWRGGQHYPKPVDHHRAAAERFLGRPL